MIFITISLAVAIYLTYVFFKLDANPLLAFYERFYPNKKRLSGSTAWVVGASTGIGEALCYQLAELGCKLILTSTTESKLNEVKKECIKRSKNSLKSDDILVLAYDISDFKKNDEALKTIIDKFGNVDLLFNNAARIYYGSLEDNSFENHRKLYDINYFANIYIAEMAIRHWRKTESKDKIIMPTSSIGAYLELPYVSSYTAAKRALNAVYRDFAVQTYNDGINICISCPGPTESELSDKSLQNKMKSSYSVRMTSERCAELMLVAAANRLSESWQCQQPHLLITYLMHFGYYQIHYIMKIFNLKNYFRNMHEAN